MKTCWGFLLSVLFLAGSGCVAYRPQVLVPEETSRQLESRDLEDEGLRGFLSKSYPDRISEWPLKRWDLELLTGAAAYFHPDIQVARAHLRVIEAGELTAGARPNPVVGITPEYNFSAASGSPAWLPAGTIDWPIETAGKRSRRKEAAQHNTAAARYGVITAAWTVRSNLRAAWLDLGVAQRRRELLEKLSMVQEAMVKSMQERQAEGALALSELTPAALFLNRTRIDLADTLRLESESRARIAASVGIPAVSLERVTLANDFPRPSNDVRDMTSTEARRRALTGRADVLSGMSEYLSAESALRLEIAKQYPDIHLGTGYQWDQAESKWHLGVTMEVPLLNRNQGPIREAEARRDEVRAKFVALQSKVIGEIDHALAGLEAARKQLGDAQESVSLQRKQLERVRAQKALGAADRNDVLLLEVEVQSSEVLVLELLSKWNQAIGALEDALQEPAVLSPRLLAPLLTKEMSR
jgi:cobalt-zinc-cadmium efflux system outer membrane protein